MTPERDRSAEGAADHPPRTAPGHCPDARKTDLARARRLLLWYPRGWRSRYGDEFAELLIDERAELGPSWRCAVNIAATGLRARLAAAGLADHPVDQDAAARAGLATMAICAAAAILTGAVMWSQLAIGLQWSVPAGNRITQAIDFMSAALLALAVAALLALAPAVWAAVTSAWRGQARALRRPAIMFAGGALVLVVGGRHFASAWPGTGGHLLTHQSLIPGRVAAFGWAATMWITSYWAHPRALAEFPASELAWMMLSPVATGCLVIGVAQVLRRIQMSPRMLRYEMCVGHLALAGLVAFLCGGLCWLSLSSGEPGRLFLAGTIDRAGLAVLAVSVVAGAAAVRRSMAAARWRPTRPDGG
jgi:hypothetical protein